MSYAVNAVKNTYSVRLVHNVIALFKLIERAYLLPRLVLAFMLFTLGRYKPMGYKHKFLRGYFKTCRKPARYYRNARGCGIGAHGINALHPALAKLGV